MSTLVYAATSGMQAPKFAVEPGRRLRTSPPSTSADSAPDISQRPLGSRVVDDAGISQAASPSLTAKMAALGRATHLHHHGLDALLADWLAWPFVGPEADAIVGGLRPLLAADMVPTATWFAARARLTEDWLAASDTHQYVVLGAGLDTFAWRQSSHVRVFEVDHPGTQIWKQQRAGDLDLRQPAELVYVPVDFEHDRVGPALERADLDATRGTFVSWLGVTQYLTGNAIAATLDELPPCSLAVSYVVPDANRDEDARRVGAFMEQQARAIGEPWHTLVSPSECADLLAGSGFVVTDDVGPHDIQARYGLRALAPERIALAHKSR